MKTFILKTWNYFRSSWEGEDGKFSYKRATILVFVIMMVRLSLFRIQNEWEFKTFLIFAILFALQTSIITVSQMIVLLRYKLRGSEEEAGAEPLPAEEESPA